MSRVLRHSRHTRALWILVLVGCVPFAIGKVVRADAAVPKSPNEVQQFLLSESEPTPEPGRGRRIDPPSDAAITHKLLGQELRVTNVDTDWTAEKVCIELGRSAHIELTPFERDEIEVRCLTLKPLEDRTLTVTPESYTDVKLGCVQWGRSRKGPSAILPPKSAIQIIKGGPGDFTVKNLDPKWTAERLCVTVLFHSMYGGFTWQRYTCVKKVLPLAEQAVKIGASSEVPFTWEASLACIQWAR